VLGLKREMSDVWWVRGIARLNHLTVAIIAPRDELSASSLLLAKQHPLFWVATHQPLVTRSNDGDLR